MPVPKGFVDDLTPSVKGPAGFVDDNSRIDQSIGGNGSDHQQTASASGFPSMVSGGLGEVGNIISGIYQSFRHPIDAISSFPSQEAQYGSQTWQALTGSGPYANAGVGRRINDATDNAVAMIPLIGPAMKGTSDAINRAADRPYFSPDRGAAFTDAASLAAPEVLREAYLDFPTRARAGRLFGEVQASAGSMPIDVQAPGDVALRMRDMASLGGRLPKVVKDFITRATDPTKQGPITFEEGRDFYSNAGGRLSVDEINKMTPQMRRALGEFSSALNSSLTEVADAAGKGPEYLDAMRQYRTINRIGKIGDAVRGVATKGAVNAIGLAPYYALFSRLMGR